MEKTIFVVVFELAPFFQPYWNKRRTFSMEFVQLFGVIFYGWPNLAFTHSISQRKYHFEITNVDTYIFQICLRSTHFYVNDWKYHWIFALALAMCKGSSKEQIILSFRCNTYIFHICCALINTNNTSNSSIYHCLNLYFELFVVS